MASKSKLARQAITKKDKKVNFYLIAIPVFGFVVKLITMMNTPNGGWLGADGENYFSGVDGLLADGYFSDKSILSYWPAGYPILLWGLAKISVAQIIWLISITQTLFYAYASYYFVKQLRDTKLRPYLFLIGLALAFNPTLSLSSMAVGYESPIASCMLLITGLILKLRDKKVDSRFILLTLSVGILFALSTFMQPRFLLVAIIIAVLWALKVIGTKNRIRIAALVTAIMMMAPAIMIVRNAVTIDRATISTNLGVTMRIGAGPETSGGYDRSGPEVPCEPKVPATTVTDNELVVCVLKWYLTNPLDTARLSFNKAIYFWSPWSGPEATGTMARNPWLKISPVQQIGSSNQDGQGLVFGPFGVAISYLWIIGQIFFLFLGYRSLRKLGQDELFFARILIAPVLVSWLLALGTIGDHRFRVPTMSMSLALQVIAILTIRKKLNDRVG
jgi:hypothetical protein